MEADPEDILALSTGGNAGARQAKRDYLSTEAWVYNIQHTDQR